MKGSADDWTGMGLALLDRESACCPKNHGETWRNMMNIKKHVSSGLGYIGIGSFIDSGKTKAGSPVHSCGVRAS